MDTAWCVAIARARLAFAPSSAPKTAWNGNALVHIDAAAPSSCTLSHGLPLARRTLLPHLGDPVIVRASRRTCLFVSDETHGQGLCSFSA